jgi:transposase
MTRNLLTDEQWDVLRPFFDVPSKSTGRPRKDARRMLDGVLWIMRTGAPWRDLPEEFGKWATVYEYFSQWRVNGTFDSAHEHILLELKKDDPAEVVLWFVDSTILRASRAAAGAKKKSAAPK